MKRHCFKLSGSVALPLLEMQPPGPTPEQLAAQRRIAAALSEIAFALPGSLVWRNSRCGNPRCRCHADPPQLHGPYPTWTRAVHRKTVTKTLSEEQARQYQSWFENGDRLRQLVRELEELSVEVIKTTEGWT